jgi:hypothetical protein
MVGMLSFIVMVCLCVEAGLDEGSVSSADCFGCRWLYSVE